MASVRVLFERTPSIRLSFLIFQHILTLWLFRMGRRMHMPSTYSFVHSSYVSPRVGMCRRCLSLSMRSRAAESDMHKVGASGETLLEEAKRVTFKAKSKEEAREELEKKYKVPPPRNRDNEQARDRLGLYIVITLIVTFMFRMISERLRGEEELALVKKKRAELLSRYSSSLSKGDVKEEIREILEPYMLSSAEKARKEEAFTNFVADLVFASSTELRQKSSQLTKAEDLS